MFKRLYEKLCCMHEWEERYNATVYDSDSSHNLDIPSHYIVVLFCKKCGKIKQVKY